MFLEKYFVWNITTGGYRLVEKYEIAYHFYRRGTTPQWVTHYNQNQLLSVPLYELKLQWQWRIKLSVNRRPAMGNTIYIVINDYHKNQHVIWDPNNSMPIGTKSNLGHSHGDVSKNIHHVKL